MFSLEGQTALVTGASRGIGLAIARAFIDAGARVIITARGAEGLDAATAGLGPNAIGLTCDQGDPAAIAAMVEQAWAISPIDVLVNNAGISPYFKRIEHVTVEDWDSVVDVNQRGMFFTTQDIARRMFEAGRPGSIVNVSSMLGVLPLERQSVYAATKAAVHQLTKAMALEWAPRGVRVNAIAPGWVETDMNRELFSSRHGEPLLADVPMGRLARPDEVTGAALYLASAASSYVTGSILVVDGGRTLR